MKVSAQRSSRLSTTENQQIIEEIERKASGEIISHKYTRGRFLGKGGFAKCYEITSAETQKVTAVKIISKASLTKNHAKQKLMTEINIHKSLKNTHVVGFVNHFEDHENVYILLELCENQTLHELIRRRRRLTELETQCYMVQLIEGLNYLHSHRVIHRDLKLGNLFLTEKMELKIADFGLAAKLEFEGERKRTICGTPNYIAPEILEGKRGHSYEVDIWSLGVILYTLLIGKPPFETQDVKTTYKKIRMNAYAFPVECAISECAKDLIQKILTSEPTKRPNLKEIMNHKFFTGNPIPKLLPSSTLACPPSSSYIKQYCCQQSNTQENVVPLNMASTVSLKPTPKTKDTPLITARESKKAAFYPLASARGQTENIPRQNIVIPSPTPKPKIQQEIPESGGTETPIIGPTVWVTKSIDFSSKWGLGYMLSNGFIGVFFNDSSKILLQAPGQEFKYMERRSTEREDTINSYSLTEYPKEILKKVTLLQHFKSCLTGDSTKIADIQQDDKNKEMVYVKKWMKTSHANMFRLSNKTVQVKFNDETEIILNSEKKVVTYANKNGERTSYKLNTALESANKEMTSRLKYTKDLLTRMVNPKQKANRQAPAMP